jgi:hypothetical protein
MQALSALLYRFVAVALSVVALPQRTHLSVLLCSTAQFKIKSVTAYPFSFQSPSQTVFPAIAIDSRYILTDERNPAYLSEQLGAFRQR